MTTTDQQTIYAVKKMINFGNIFLEKYSPSTPKIGETIKEIPKLKSIPKHPRAFNSSEVFYLNESVSQLERSIQYINSAYNSCPLNDNHSITEQIGHLRIDALSIIEQILISLNDS